MGGFYLSLSMGHISCVARVVGQDSPRILVNHHFESFVFQILQALYLLPSAYPLPAILHLSTHLPLQKYKSTDQKERDARVAYSTYKDQERRARACLEYCPKYGARHGTDHRCPHRLERAPQDGHFSHDILRLQITLRSRLVFVTHTTSFCVRSDHPRLHKPIHPRPFGLSQCSSSSSRSYNTSIAACRTYIPTPARRYPRQATTECHPRHPHNLRGLELGPCSRRACGYRPGLDRRLHSHSLHHSQRLPLRRLWQQADRGRRGSRSAPSSSDQTES